MHNGETNMPIIRRTIAIGHSKAITIPKSWITNAEDNLVEDWKIIEKYADDKQSSDNSKDPLLEHIIEFSGMTNHKQERLVER